MAQLLKPARRGSRRPGAVAPGEAAPVAAGGLAVVEAPTGPAPECDYSRIHRLLRIIWLIQAQKGWTAGTLARECGVTQRTIYRDLQMLQGAGIPYFYDARLRCYQIRRDFFMKPVDLTLDEALALVALGEHIAARDQVPFTRAAARAVAKVRSQLPESIRRELEGLDPYVRINLAQASTAADAADVYEKVRAAIRARRILECRYESLGGKGAARSFELQPYALFFCERAWYVVGMHGGHREIRCLKLNRFSAMTATDKPYGIPPGFSLQKHLGNAWRMIRGKPSYRVELHFDAQFADTIAETHWHDTQECDWQADGSLLFRCTVDGLDEIVWWVLSMGPHCRVRQPVELARRVKDLAAAVVKRY